MIPTSVAGGQTNRTINGIDPSLREDRSDPTRGQTRLQRIRKNNRSDDTARINLLQYLARQIKPNYQNLSYLRSTSAYAVVSYMLVSKNQLD